MATGSYVYRDAYYGQRLILTLSRSGSTINYSLKLQSTGSMYASTPWSLSGNHSASGNASVSLGGAGTATLATGSFSRSAATTVSASASLFWGGTAKVSASIGAAGSPPSPPTGVSWTRSSGRNLTIHFSRGSGATSTHVQMKYLNNAWQTLTSNTGTSIPIARVAANGSAIFRLYSSNNVGNSLYASVPGVFYTTPATPSRPSVRVVNNTVEITVADSAYYKQGLEIERSDGATWLQGNGTSGRVDGYTDTAPYGVDLKYRARRFVGAEGEHTRVFGNWSDWSTPVTAIPAPEITRFTAERCDSTGALNPLGTYLRVISSGTVADVAGNRFLRRFRRRPVGGDWKAWVTDGKDLAATSWTNRALTLFSGNIAVTTAYDIQMQVVDSFTSTSQMVQVSTGETAMSLSRTGMGAGKIWERGALDVGGDAYVDGDLSVEGEIFHDGKQIIYGTTTEVTVPANGTTSVTYPVDFADVPLVTMGIKSASSNVQGVLSRANTTKDKIHFVLRNNGPSSYTTSVEFIAIGSKP